VLRRCILAAPAALTLSLLAAPVASAERFAAVDSSNRLYTFDDDRPRDWTRKALRGLGAGERIVGLDVRPATRQLVALTDRDRLYVIARGRGRATAIGGGPFMPSLAGRSFGFDFNPTVDRIRLVSDSGQNLRLNPESGAVAAVDGTLRYRDGDVAAGVAPAVLGSAYTNSVRGAMETTLYNVDSARDALVVQAPPNEGVLSTVGTLGVNLTGPLGFDISARDGRAYVLARRARAPRSRLFRVDLASGRARQLGVVSKAPSLVALAALSAPRGR
jgi:hypothetical protein